MYLVAVTIGLCFTYLFLIGFFPYFFHTEKVTIKNIRTSSIALIIALSLLGYIISFLIPSIELSNRFLHAFGGGFMAFLTCYLSARDSYIALNKIRFLFVSVLIVTTLGVASELLEFILQSNTDMIFAFSVNDTWLDLASNLVGFIVGTVILFPFLHFTRT